MTPEIGRILWGNKKTEDGNLREFQLHQTSYRVMLGPITEHFKSKCYVNFTEDTNCFPLVRYCMRLR